MIIYTKTSRLGDFEEVHVDMSINWTACVDTMLIIAQGHHTIMQKSPGSCDIAQSHEQC